MINIIKCPSVNFFYGFSCLTASQLDRGPRGVSISLSTPGSVGLWPSKGIEGRFRDGGDPWERRPLAVERYRGSFQDGGDADLPSARAPTLPGPGNVKNSRPQKRAAIF